MNLVKLLAKIQRETDIEDINLALNRKKIFPKNAIKALRVISDIYEKQLEEIESHDGDPTLRNCDCVYESQVPKL